MFLSDIGDVGAAGFEDSQPNSPSLAAKAKSNSLGDSRGGQQRLELQV